MSTEPNNEPASGDNPQIEDDLRAIQRDEEKLRAVERELERDEAQLEQDLHHPQPTLEHRVEMNYHPLTLRGLKLTGLQIKEQAIAAPIPNIKIDFHLTAQRAGEETEHTVGDDDEWAVHDGDCFIAVKPDDNS